MRHSPVKGTHTERGCVLSDQLVEKSRQRIMPGGHMSKIREDIAASALPRDEGGNGVGDQLWEWCMEQIQPYKT